MAGALVSLAGLAIAAALWRLRPNLSLRATLGLWWLGLLLARVAPGLLAEIVGSDAVENLTGTGGAFVVGVSAVGAVILLRALLGLITWNRPRSRRNWVLGALFVCGMLLGTLSSSTPPGVMYLFITAFLVWVRWRKDLAAGGLTIATLTGGISLLLCVLTWGTANPEPGSLLYGLDRLRQTASNAVLMYCLIAIVPVAIRIHLSIRRIGRRLVVSHLLAGLVPGVLAALFLLTASALYLSTYRGELGSSLLADSSRTARSRLGRYLSLPEESRPFPYGDEASQQIVLTRRGDGQLRILGATPGFPPDSLLSVDYTSAEAPILWDGTTLFLRARLDTLVDGVPTRIEALAPIDSLRMVRISKLLGVPVRLSPRVKISRARGGVQIGPSDSITTSSIGPPRPEGRQLPGGTIVTCLFRTGSGWETQSIPLSSSASLMEPIRSLFSEAGENPLAIIVLIALGLIAFLIIGAIAITVAMVFRMARTITEAVSALTRATSALGEGKLDHRIPIQGEDELWSVAGSFNEMAEGLQRVREMELQTERLEEELRIARQIQDRLLPASAPILEHFELAGRSLPAREVGGDYFDYILLADGRIGLAVADVSGKGAGAALLMSSFRASLRSQDLAGLGPARTLAALNRFVCSSVDPGKFITAFLAVLDPRTGEVRYANGGHEPPLLVKDGRVLEELSDGGLILGAFASAEYEEGLALMPSGSTLAIFTDGVTEAQNPAGDFFGNDRLMDVLASRDSGDCPGLLAKILCEIQAFAGEAPQSDDITLLLARKE